MEEKMFCVRKSKKLFSCSTFVLFITAVDKKTSESKNEENNETYTVLGKMDQIMAENDFNDYGRNFSEECCPQMLSCGEFCEDCRCGKENVWRVGDCPGYSHGVYRTVFVYFS